MPDASAGSSRPAAAPVPCAQCGASVDAIRAPRVSATEGGFHYFCSSECQQIFFSGMHVPPAAEKSESPRRRQPSLPHEPIAERTDSQHDLRRALHEVANPAEVELDLKR